MQQRLHATAHLPHQRQEAFEQVALLPLEQQVVLSGIEELPHALGGHTFGQVICLGLRQRGKNGLTLLGSV
ncbi:hypothetical protein D9M69_536110 [compost metagenome]